MRRGFTLVELITVLAILGVTAAAVAPAIADIGRQNAALNPIRALDSLLRATRLQALDEGAAVHLSIDPKTGRYWVNEREATGDVLGLQGMVIEAREPRLHVTFHADGRVDAEAFVVRSTAGVFSISVEPWLGDPRVNAR